MDSNTCYQNLQHTVSQLIQYIKQHIQQFEIILINSEINNISNIKTNIKNIITNGSNHINMINRYLEMIIIKEENQSTKFIIEECIQNSYAGDRFINLFLDIIKLINNNEIKKRFELANVRRKSPEMVGEIEQLLELFQEDFDNEIIIKVNSYLSDYRFTIIKIRDILKKINN